MVQLFPDYPVLLCVWFSDKTNFMSELLMDYYRAMQSQNTKFMNVVAGRLMDEGYEREAEFVIEQIFYLTEGIMKKNIDSVSNRFNLIMMCASEIPDIV